MTPEDNLKRMLDGTRGPDNVDESDWTAFSSKARRSLRTQRLLGAGAAVVVVGLAVFAAISFIDPTGNGTDVPQPATGTVSPKDIKVTLTKQEVWFVDSETQKLSWGIHPVSVENDETLRAVIEEVLEGPNPNEIDAGRTTDIPEGTRLLRAPVENAVATIDLSRDFLGGNQPSGYLELREAQIVFAATQLPEVDQVEIIVEGEPYEGGAFPATRRDYDDVAPPIVIELPKIGAEVEQPLYISGTANVFEATVTIEVDKTEEVERPLQTFATATCGSGCRGEFSKRIELDIDEPTTVEVRVYEESAEDGLARHMISLPVTLLPEN